MAEEVKLKMRESQEAEWDFMLSMPARVELRATDTLHFDSEAYDEEPSYDYF